MVTSSDTVPLPGPAGEERRTWRGAYETDPVGFLTACQARWGDIFRLDDELVVVCEPERTHRILVTTHRDSVPGAQGRNGTRLPSVDTGEWRQTRRPAAQLLTPQGLRGHLPTLDRAVAAGLRSLAHRDRFDPLAVAEETCLRAALPIYLPDPPPTLLPALLAFAKASRDLGDAAVILPRWWPSLMRHRLRSADRRVDAELRGLLATDTTGRPSGSPTDPPTLLEELHAERLPADLAVKVMRKAMTTGVLSMAGAWCWLLHDLATHPEEVERIRAEAPCQDPGAELPYTTAFVRESLRIHPPLWLLARTLTRPTQITDEFTAYAGTKITLSPYLIHHDARYWPEPDRFNPHRWTTPHPERHRHAYLPFGAGPRVCTGLHLAQVLLTLTASHIATHYQLTVTTPPTAPTFKMVSLPSGLTLELTPRP